MSLRKIWALSTLGAALASPAAGATLRMEAATSWVENINRASGPADWRDALRHEARASLALLRQWAPGFVTGADFGAGYERVPQFTKLDAVTAGASVNARQKFGFGAFAPFVAADASLRRRDARLGPDDGWTATGALRIGQRLTRAVRVSATGDWEQHYARSSIFDTRHHRAFGLVAWDITDRVQVSHGNGRLWGDFTASASAAVWPRALAGALGADLAAYYRTIPWAALDVFGPGYVTYRVTGRVSFWWLEVSPAIGPNTSLPLRYESRFSVNKVGVKYRQDVWTLQLLHRF